MKVLLIQPPAFSGDPLTLYLTDYRYLVPQLGLLYVAAAVEREHEVRLLDLNLEQTQFSTVDRLTQRVLDVAREYAPDLAGFSTMANVYPLALHLAGQLKEALPGVTVVFGGHQATFTAEETLARFPQVDCIVIGESENVFPRLLRELEEGRGPQAVEGLAWRHGEETRVNPPPPLVRDLETLAPPAYHLLPPLERYQPHSQTRRLNILTSRGCPYACSFCSVSPFWRRQVRYRRPSAVVDELAWLHDGLGAGFIEFNDDTFTTSRRFLQEVCRAILDRRLELEWLCRARAGSLDEESAALLRRAGCTHVFVGAESGAERILSYIHKDIAPAEVRETVRLLSGQGIETLVSFMYGFPVETAEEILLSARLARECLHQGARWVTFQRLTALPGTKMSAEVSGEISLAGSYVSGSPILADRAFLEETRRMVLGAPRVFPSFFRLRLEHFAAEEELARCVGDALRDLNLDGGMIL